MCPPRSMGSTCLHAGSEFPATPLGRGAAALASPLQPPSSPRPALPLHQNRGGRQKRQPVIYSYSEVWLTGISYTVIDILYFSLFLSPFFVFNWLIQCCSDVNLFFLFSTFIKSSHAELITGWWLAQIGHTRHCLFEEQEVAGERARA